MSVQTDSLITNAGRLAAGDSSSVANIITSAQFGIGANLVNIDGATPLVMPPTTIIVTHVPTMFADIPNAPATLKALIERHAQNVTGIDWGLQLDAAPQPAGHDGQELNMPTNSKRTPVNPSFEFPEISGNLVWNFFKMWIELIKSPDTQASKMSALQPSTAMTPQLMSYFTMDICCIQYDVTKRPENIINGYFITNMWPQETGLGGYQRQIGTSNKPERTIPFHGIVQESRNTFLAAQKIATALNAHTVNYDYATPVATSVESTVADEGLTREINADLSAFTSIA